jgi:hypothetical protein
MIAVALPVEYVNYFGQTEDAVDGRRAIPLERPDVDLVTGRQAALRRLAHHANTVRCQTETFPLQRIAVPRGILGTIGHVHDQRVTTTLLLTREAIRGRR